MIMNLYHFIDKTTNLVVYADKPEQDALATIKATHPGFLVVASNTGQQNAPNIFPGFLFHDGIFWSPQRMANQVTSTSTTLDKDDFLRLLTFAEMVALYNFQDDTNLSVESKRLINAFLRYMDGTTRINLSHPTVLTALNYFESAGYITPGRKSEILAVTYMQ